MTPRKLYSPPDRGRAAPSCVYERAPHNAQIPPAIQSAMMANPVGSTVTWNARLVKVAVPSMLPTPMKDEINGFETKRNVTDEIKSAQCKIVVGSIRHSKRNKEIKVATWISNSLDVRGKGSHAAEVN